MRLSFLFMVPLLVAFSEGVLVFEQTQLFRDRVVPFVEPTVIPPIADATCLQVEITGESIHTIEWITFGWGRLFVGERGYHEGAFLGMEELLVLSATYPSFETGFFPPMTVLTFVFIEDFHGVGELADPELATGGEVQWVAQSSMAGVGGSGSWSMRSRARHTMRVTARVFR